MVTCTALTLAVKVPKRRDRLNLLFPLYFGATRRGHRGADFTRTVKTAIRMTETKENNA